LTDDKLNFDKKPKIPKKKEKEKRKKRSKNKNQILIIKKSLLTLYMAEFRYPPRSPFLNPHFNPFQRIAT
jgi:hypothetical protein